MVLHMNKIITACIIIAFLSSIQISCSYLDDFFGDNDAGKVQKYYSSEQPGKWSAQAGDHDLEITIIEDAKGKKGIEVSVPFTRERDERHYVEVIAIEDQKGREIAIQRFNRGDRALALFEVTDRIKFPVYAVAKCNMHDMWRKIIVGNEKPHSKGDQ